MKRVIGSIDIPMPGGLTYQQPRYEKVQDVAPPEQLGGGQQNSPPAAPRRRIMGRPAGVPKIRTE